MNDHDESEVATSARQAGDVYFGAWADWVQEAWRIEASSFSAMAALVATAGARAARAPGWSQWWDEAATLSRDAAEELVKREAEMLGALTQYNAQAAKMLVDLGSGRTSNVDRLDSSMNWLRPWLALTVLRPPQIA